MFVFLLVYWVPAPPQLLLESSVIQLTNDWKSLRLTAVPRSDGDGEIQVPNNCLGIRLTGADIWWQSWVIISLTVRVEKLIMVSLQRCESRHWQWSPMKLKEVLSSLFNLFLRKTETMSGCHVAVFLSTFERVSSYSDTLMSKCFCSVQTLQSEILLFRLVKRYR
jgi:hypothetical protein